MPELPGGRRWLGGRRIGPPVSGGSDGSVPVRRSGPPDEEPWWVPADQVLAEVELIDRRTLGRGWRPVPMVNNSERLRPFGDDEASVAVESARSARRPTALDEGRAWRHRDAGTLAVVRSEVFADDLRGAAAAHRAAWREHAEAALDATWRQRWLERDRSPAWIEARWVDSTDEDGANGSEGSDGSPRGTDWLRIEDHTPAVGGQPSGEPGAISVYEHLTVWAGRRQATVVVRHVLGLDLDDVVERVTAGVTARLRQV